MPHLADGHPGDFGQERLTQAKSAAKESGAAEQAAQDVPAPVISRDNPVRNKEGDTTAVLHSHPHGVVYGLVSAVLFPGQSGYAFEQRGEQVGLVDRRFAGDHRQRPLQPHAGIDVRTGQRGAVSGFVLVVLGEDQVP